MNIGILISSDPTPDRFTTVDRLEEAGKALGHNIVRLYSKNMTFARKTNKLEIRLNNEPLPKLDVILSRPTFIEEPSIHAYVTDLLEEAGYTIVTTGEAVTKAKNKLAQHTEFVKHNIPSPPFVIARSPEQALTAAQELGFPVVVKVAFGTLGKGVFYADSLETFQPIAEYLAIRDGNPLIIERFIDEADRKDLRVFVIDSQVVAAMERQAPDGDIRANATTGGTGYKVELTEEERELAIRTAEVFNLSVCGVDIIRSSKGPLVLEINANPGFRELERVTNIDVAKKIIEFVATQAKDNV